MIFLQSVPAIGAHSVFHNAQPRTLSQVSASKFNACRNTSQLVPDKNVQAIAKSQAGSPIHI